MIEKEHKTIDHNNKQTAQTSTWLTNAGMYMTLYKSLDIT